MEWRRAHVRRAVAARLLAEVGIVDHAARGVPRRAGGGRAVVLIGHVGLFDIDRNCVGRVRVKAGIASRRHVDVQERDVFVLEHRRVIGGFEDGDGNVLALRERESGNQQCGGEQSHVFS